MFLRKILVYLPAVCACIVFSQCRTKRSKSQENKDLNLTSTKKSTDIAASSPEVDQKLNVEGSLKSTDIATSSPEVDQKLNVEGSLKSADIATSSPEVDQKLNVEGSLIGGTWFDKCEKNDKYMLGISFLDDKKVTLENHGFSDSSCSNPAYSISAAGTYSIGADTKVSNAKSIDFNFSASATKLTFYDKEEIKRMNLLLVLCDKSSMSEDNTITSTDLESLRNCQIIGGSDIDVESFNEDLKTLPSIEPPPARYSIYRIDTAAGQLFVGKDDATNDSSALDKRHVEFDDNFYTRK